MKKVLIFTLTIVLICVFLTSCKSDESADSPAPGGSGETNGDGDSIHLTLWGGEYDTQLLRTIADSFIAANSDRADITIDVGVHPEPTLKYTVLADINGAADVFTFPDDQFFDLHRSGALLEITKDTDAIISANSAVSVRAATADGKLFAYPLTADNGYFMFYNSSYFTPEDVQSIDKMLEIAAESDKKITMDLENSWYLYSFFKGAGLDMYMTDDGYHFCNWNEDPGVAVLKAILDIAAHPGFIALDDDGFIAAVEDGTVIAGVNGPWHSFDAAQAWGENYAAAKLPEFTMTIADANSSQVQMASFSGYKLLGVNAYSKNPEWAMELAQWVSNYDNQMLRFKERRQGPSNIQAAAEPEVIADPALAALQAQAAFSHHQSFGENYKKTAEILGSIIVRGNPDGIDLKELLDTTVAGITAPPAS